MRILSFFVIFAVFLTPMMHAKPIDVCAHIDAQLTGKIGGIVQSFGQLDLCLCLSEIPEFVLTNKVVVKAVAVMGFSYIIAELKELIHISPHCSPVRSRSINKHDRRRDRECLPGYSLCSIQSSWSSGSWECVDTDSDLWSCGGCTTGYSGQPTTGQDCTAIEGVQDVACIKGACSVISCSKGYRVNGRSCIPEDIVPFHAFAPIGQIVAGSIFQSI